MCCFLPVSQTLTEGLTRWFPLITGNSCVRETQNIFSYTCCWYKFFSVCSYCSKNDYKLSCNNPSCVGYTNLLVSLWNSSNKYKKSSYFFDKITGRVKEEINMSYLMAYFKRGQLNTHVCTNNWIIPVNKMYAFITITSVIIYITSLSYT